MKPPKRFLEGLLNLYKDDTAKFLTHTAAISWVLASAANILGISLNKKLEPKEKKFLIPQELADGAVNIGLFYTVTRGLTKGAEKLFDKGIIQLDNIAKNTDSFNKVKTGALVLTSAVGAVLSRNILTPIIRGEYAAARQKKTLEMEQEKIIPNRSLTYFKQGELSPMKMNSFIAFTRTPNLKI